jgi:polar amino acid transport system permease protein
MAEGAEITLKLTLISGLAGLVIGVLTGMFRLSSRALVRLPATFYIWVTRGTPLLVQILFAYNALPLLLRPLWPEAQQALTPYWAAFIALSFNVGAYNAEVVRAGIQAIPKGQWEAAWSLGLSPADVMRFIILPQALRIVVPPLVNNVVALLKDSSLASVITLTELALSGQRIISATFRPVEVYLAVAAIYLLLTTVLTQFTNRLEERLRVAGR